MGRETDVRTGFDEDERTRVGGLYWEAFQRKLKPAFADDRTGEEFVTAAMRPDRVITARLVGAVIGVCGVHHEGRGAFDPAWPATRKRLGPWSGARALLALSLLEHRAEEGVLVLDGICVSPSHRGRGIGSRLMDAVDAYASRHGLHTVELSVVDTNPRAEALYRRLGFEPVDTGALGLLSGLYGFAAYTTLRRRIGGGRAA
ncbi:GNAT family N-acetyltransferase [Nocardiopsis valliformis]|uniref:GNAT family N-acetyltransferase n=1 Tax=Nocardiopsis valliformis TaxID=239974 RepID=UPI00034CBFCC|nr:GNAT family N-acetyltransferase [Nocardiopsis valliformis]